MGNTEMTKYMAAGAFAPLDKTQFDNSSNWLPGLAASGKYGGKTYGVPYYAGSRVVTYRKDLFKQAGITKLPTSTAEYAADAKKLLAKNPQKGFSPVYIAGTTGTSGWLRLRLRWRDRESGQRYVEEPAQLAEVTRRPHGVQELLPRDLAGVEDERRDQAEPLRRLRTGVGGVDGRPELVHLLRRQEVHGVDGSVRDAGPRQGPDDAGLPRRLRPRRTGDELQQALAAEWIKDFTSTSSEKALQAKGNIPNATNLLGNSVNERAAARSWFVPTAKHWVDVENGNILKQHVGPDPHRQPDRQAGGRVGRRQHRIGAESAVARVPDTEHYRRRRRDHVPPVSAAAALWERRRGSPFPTC